MVEDLKKWIGKKFLDFCKSDPTDERGIHYTLIEQDGNAKVSKDFSSDDIVSMEMMEKIRKSTIRSLSLSDNWWHVSLEYKEEEDMQQKEMTKMEQLEAEKEEFKQMYAECFPHLAIVADILEKFKEKGSIDTNGASVWITPGGYISMENASEGWKLFRLNSDSKPEITCEIREEIE